MPQPDVYDTLRTRLLCHGSHASARALIDTDHLQRQGLSRRPPGNNRRVEETLAGSYFRVEGAPSAPALIAPANGSDVDNVTPLLSVSNAADPNDDKLSYNFEIYSDSALTQLVTSGTIRRSNRCSRHGPYRPR